MTITIPTSRLVSAEQFMVAICNLNCKYCYIPKSDSMKLLNRKVVKELKENSWLDSLEEVYGNDLTHFGLWGAEPTLTLEKVSFRKLLERFPKLKEISFSTNLMTNLKVLIKAVEQLEKACNRQVLFKLQVSLDGPAYITDINRITGASEKIPRNLNLFAANLSEKKLQKVRIEIRTKSTLAIGNIRLLNAEPEKIKEYFDYFSQIQGAFRKINKNNRVKFDDYCSPTLCVPGRYTSQDGKALAKFFRHLKEGKFPNAYLSRFQRILRFRNELATKPSMFTCSGGDSNMGVGIKGDLHLCHRTFYFNHPEYIESILSQKRMDNWDVSLFEEGKIDFINKRFIVNVKDEAEKVRLFYVLRNYHDFWRLKVGYIIAMLKELALVGQVSECYLNERLAVVFALFMNVCLSCPMENLLNTGTIHFSPVSLIRMFANGAFEEILEQGVPGG